MFTQKASLALSTSTFSTVAAASMVESNKPDTSSSLLNQLSAISPTPKWILFTAEAILPTAHELESFGIDSMKVVKIKPSLNLTEKDIIIKALNARNASAIVASDHFSTQEIQQLTHLAFEANCAIFFMDQTAREQLSRHFH